ncbi:MAG: GerMN domain-containing protein [Actinobacteria bacterium]|nr:MAG: GerMN domain-containing protein [Actinomycetota bacterium]
MERSSPTRYRRGVRSVLLLMAVAVATPGCGDHGHRPASTSANATVYFLTDRGTAPLGVRRSIRRSSPFARQSLEALLEGPTEAERDAGITSAIPKGATLRSFSIAPSLSRTSGTATVDLGDMPSVDETGAVNVARVVTQVARTLIGLSGIERVRLRVDGQPWGFTSMHPPNRALDQLWDYRALLGLYGICEGTPGAETPPRDCFSALP